MADLFPRCSGILLHPTSLPGRFGIGDLGDNAYRFIDWLAEHGQSVWQILPLGPTSYGDSPYQTLSAFAGNPNLIALDKFIEYGWLDSSEFDHVPDFPTSHVDYGWVIPYHEEILSKAYDGFLEKASKEQQAGFRQFITDNEDWLESFALFAALKKAHGGVAWVEWEDKYITRQPKALTQATKDHARAIDEQKFRQWIFFRQWYHLAYYAGQKGVRIMGDIPIFVAHDSSDVWANQDLFHLDEKGQPQVIAGVPPDYFSPTGQRWGNPLYKWETMTKNRYAWWIKRFKAALSMVDLIRIDHFRGFQAYWEIPATEETAINGEWVEAPGHDLFKVIQEELGQLPIVAEDLGVITKEVEALRDAFNLPGMKVLQFAWSDSSNLFLPHNHPVNSVVYTGTHDNNTTIGWWHHEASSNAKNFMQTYLEREIREINWRMVQVACESAAHTAIFPMQDILNLGSEARMNTPGKEQGNWQWRFAEHDFDHDGKHRLAYYTGLYQRRPDQQVKAYGDSAIQD